MVYYFYFFASFYYLILRDTADIVHYATIVYVERETIASWHIGQEHVIFEYDKVVVNICFRCFHQGTCTAILGVWLVKYVIVLSYDIHTRAQPYTEECCINITLFDHTISNHRFAM